MRKPLTDFNGKARCAMTSRMSAASPTVRVSGPAVSSVGQSGRMFSTETKPCVGRTPEMPQNAAGRRTEPPVSEPSAAKFARAATDAPDPDDEPPVIRSVFQGLRQWP